MAARLAAPRQIGQQKADPLRSSVPPNTCNLTRAPRWAGVTVRTGRPNAASRLAPCCVADF